MDIKEKNIDKLIHDINSGLFSIQQAIDLVSENIHKDLSLIETLIPLATSKMEIIITDWEVLKSKIKS